MFEVVNFKKEHILPMLGQPQNLYLASWIEEGHDALMEEQKSSFTGLVKGKVAVCGGVTELWRDRGFIWTIFNEDFKSNFVPVFRGLKDFIRDYPCRRLEMAVPLGCMVGRRRAALLGFECEGIARKFLASGEDCALYALVRG